MNQIPARDSVFSPQSRSLRSPASSLPWPSLPSAGGRWLSWASWVYLQCSGEHEADAVR